MFYMNAESDIYGYDAVEVIEVDLAGNVSLPSAAGGGKPTPLTFGHFLYFILVM